MSMYVRVKRLKTTLFLHVDPGETVLELKSKIQASTDSVERPGGVPVAEMRLLAGVNFTVVLQDARQLRELKIENDTVLALVFLEKGETGELAGGWEAVAIEHPGGSVDAEETRLDVIG